jgi:glycosyltransferase involved in cell wall biosynthesis
LTVVAGPWDANDRTDDEPDQSVIQTPGPMPIISGPDPSIAEMAASAGLRRILLLAWRDLDDPEAGGSELHAANVARLWAEAGLDVVMRTSRATGLPDDIQRDGYCVRRRAGRYAVFARHAATGMVRARPDGMVEIWNGMPFFSPLWARCPGIVFLHHVHGEMWDMALPRSMLAGLGKAIECKIAPPLYRRTRILTLSPSSRTEIIRRLRLPADNITVAPPGVDHRFRPGGRRSPLPLVAAVGRLVPVKRFHLLIDVLADLRARHPNLQAVIAGEGHQRDSLTAHINRRRAGSWLRLPGRLDDDQLVSLYRRAWVVASTSAREGWGMTLTEAGACRTPAVATAIAGHVDAVSNGVSGLLAHDRSGLTAALDAVLSNRRLRQHLAKGAAAKAATLKWNETARSAMVALAAEARAQRRE